MSLPRETVGFSIDAYIEHNGSVFRIDQLLHFKSIVATDVESGRTNQIRMHELKTIVDTQNDDQKDITDIPAKDWLIAQKRYIIIKPFTGGAVAGRTEVQRQAKKYASLPPRCIVGLSYIKRMGWFLI